jgi:chromosome segregation protein
VRIKRLQLAGFKSCMERTTLDFPRGITGIVGPNGCGKSNIVDALRWVLGEQSAKHLRGAVMEDVIFSGNERFAPLGMAEVTITLDNEGPLPSIATDSEEIGGEPSPIVALLREASEIEVTRRLYRSGESEYLINGRPCRLRDITELFLGTGVGTKAYSIIEQGRVGQIVNAKPEELRLFVEEAAGTTLYRARKLAAERKIERTRNNLLRVSDIVAELERQAGTLRRQVRGALRYKELKAEEDRLDRLATGLRLHSIATRTTELVAELDERRRQENEVREEAKAAASRRDGARSRQDNANLRAEEARRAYYETRGRLTAVTQERQFLEQRVGELSGLIETGAAELSAVESKLDAARRDAASAETERARHEADLSQTADSRRACESELDEGERAVTQALRDMEAIREHSIAALAEEARLSNEFSSVTKQRDAAADRLARLREEEGSLDTVTKQLLMQIDFGKRRLDDLVIEIDSTSGGKESATKRVRDLLGRRTELERIVEQRRGEVSSLGSRYDSLRELSESFAGYADGVRAIMRNGGGSAAGASAVVADLIDIEPGYERAVAAVLADRLQYVVVSTPDDGVRGADYLRQAGTGRASFLPRSPRGPATAGEQEDAPSGATWLRDHVRVRDGYDDAIGALLSGVAVSNGLHEAIDVWRQSPRPLTFVTPEGEVIDSAGVVTGGSGKPVDEGILARKAELRGIRIKMVDAEVKAREARAAFDTLVREAEEAGQSLTELDRRLHELTVARVGAEGDMELQRQNLLRTEDRARALAVEIDDLVREEAHAREQLSGLRARLDAVISERRGVEERGRNLEADRQRLETDREAVRGRLAAERVREAELVQQQHASALRARAFHDAAHDLEERRRSIEERLSRERSEIGAARSRLADPQLTIEALNEQLAAAQAALESLDGEVAAARVDLAATERVMDDLSTRLEALREERSGIELAVKECELERASLAEGLRERLGLEPDAVSLVAAEAGATDSGADVAGLHEELERVRASIRRLGAVNVGAVAELEEIEQRLTELTSQKNDLERSMEDLRGTIARLNRLSRQRFKDAFDRVNEIFHHTFPRLFHGGKAWLQLTDENNLLETGVEIFVQPPGKKLGNINLLSGGEKALTAVSLIFSLFLHKPSPFCVLDEVDAPLDDANIGRFARMVLEMSDRSQFLLITHNKKTMESCNRLFGVTMREPGVSRIVSVEMAR